MSNTITIELCAEDRARLDKLAELMEKQLTAKSGEDLFFFTRDLDLREPENVGDLLLSHIFEISQDNEPLPFLGQASYSLTECDFIRKPLYFPIGRCELALKRQLFIVPVGFGERRNGIYHLNGNSRLFR